MSRIIELTPEIYNRIAAGEVIENPASVVKELLENSLDAGSTVISVKVSGAGRKEISVQDNGEGMACDDLRLSVKKHATSKIKCVEDLESIGTFGFRGEALSSLVSVSQVEISSKREEDETGWRLVLSGGSTREGALAMNRGTHVRVFNLFYNTPARRKFLRSDSRESIQIREILIRMIIPHPHIRFEVEFEGERPVVYPVRKDVRERIADIYGRQFSDELLDVSSSSPPVRLEGLAGRPSFHKPNRTHQFLFLNRRSITSRYFSFWLSRAYEGFLLPGRHPVAFLFLSLDAGFFDVNVHPAKREVRFADEARVADCVIHAVRKDLNEKADIPDAGHKEEGTTERDVKQGAEKAFRLYLAKDPSSAGPYSYPPSFSGMREEPFNETGPFFTLFNAFIFYEDREKGEVLIIDQHAAHERVIYERLKRSMSEKKGLSQALLIPLPVELPDAEHKLAMEHAALFSDAGYELEDFGPTTVLLRGVPSFLRHEDDRKLFLDILSDLADGRERKDGDIRDSLLKSMACHSAVKAGDAISDDEKEALVSDLLVLEKKTSCPHGRPAVVRLKKDEIEKWFRRK